MGVAAVTRMDVIGLLCLAVPVGLWAAWFGLRAGVAARTDVTRRWHHPQ